MRDVNGGIIDVGEGKDPAGIFAQIRAIADEARKADDEELLLEAEMLEAWLALQLDTVNRQNSKYEKRLIILLEKAKRMQSLPIEISILDKLGNYYYNNTQKYNKAFASFLDVYEKVKKAKK